jgi:hypothetical protein
MAWGLNLERLFSFIGRIIPGLAGFSLKAEVGNV